MRLVFSEMEEEKAVRDIRRDPAATIYKPPFNVAFWQGENAATYTIRLPTTARTVLPKTERFAKVRGLRCMSAIN
jgi:hypothetical protein